MSKAIIILAVCFLLILVFVVLPALAFNAMFDNIFSTHGTCYTNSDRTCKESSKKECDGIWYNSNWACAFPVPRRVCYDNHKCQTIEGPVECKGRIFADMSKCQSQLK